jgi:hypothetical protein
LLMSFKIHDFLIFTPIIRYRKDVTMTGNIRQNIEALKNIGVVVSRSNIGKQIYNELMDSKPMTLTLQGLNNVSMECHVLGIGASRLVVEIDGYAVKIPRDEDGERHNNKEATIFNKVRGTGLERYFVPVIDIIDNVVIMPIVKPIARTAKEPLYYRDTTEPLSNTVREQLIDNGIIPNDTHDGNVTHDGQILDYGCFDLC